jgi:Winged helix DNA-binding domain
VSYVAGRIVRVRRIDADERRARLARRHRIAVEYQAGDAVEATRAMVCLHATDPASVYLSAWARVSGLTRADLDRALYEERTLIKHLSMRRTLFVFTRDLLAAATAGPGARVADSERRRTVREIEASAVASDGQTWLRDAEAAVLAALESHAELTSTQLREAAPIVDARMRVGSGKWATEAPVGPRLLTILSAAGLAVRGRNRGGWNVSRPIWTAMARWLGSSLALPDAAAATAQMAQAWLSVFGPGTATDLKWWLGVRATDIKRALADVGAVEVDLGATVGYVLPDDLDPVAEVEPWVALLPALDPTTMGWADRDWYLGPHRALVFDSNGNAGPTAWHNGRVVGGWHQDQSGAVVLDLVERVPKQARTQLDRRAAELTEWIAGDRVLPRFPSPLLKSAGPQ